MIKTNLPIYLASKSPRRRKLLKQINLNFKSFTVDMEEKIKPGEKPSVSVKRLSKEKLEIATQKIKHGIIITADTIVVLNKKVIGKPKDKQEAKRFLKISALYQILSERLSICDNSLSRIGYAGSNRDSLALD